MDHDKLNAAIRQGSAIELSDVLYETESGWYIIDGIEWVFDPYNKSLGTAWTTNVKLTKREWPIPGRNDITKNSQYDNDDLVLVDTGNGGSVILAYEDAVAKYGISHIQGPYVHNLDEVVVTANKSTEDESAYSIDLPEIIVTATQPSTDFDNTTVTSEDIVTNSEIPLTGLKTYMKECYKIIEQESNGKVKLVAARRWAVNEHGDKIEGNAFIENHGYYKCVNALNETLYFK